MNKQWKFSLDLSKEHIKIGRGSNYSGTSIEWLSRTPCFTHKAVQSREHVTMLFRVFPFFFGENILISFSREVEAKFSY